MLTATLLAIFLIPVLYVIVERLARSEKKMEAHLASRVELPEEAHS
jgi:hypothetical protein